jgi:hypothetical protein
VGKVGDVRFSVVDADPAGKSTKGLECSV